MKLFDLSGRVALVTGGNGGIGLGMAEGLAQAGASVEIWGTNAEKNAAAAERLRQHGAKVVSRLVDVSQEQSVVDGMDALLGEFGRLDACFANAGVVAPGSAAAVAEKAGDRVGGAGLQRLAQDVESRQLHAGSFLSQD